MISPRHTQGALGRPLFRDRAECPSCGVELDFQARLSAEGRVVAIRLHCPTCRSPLALELHVDLHPKP
jgi:C4-type Zn-finger protein